MRFTYVGDPSPDLPEQDKLLEPSTIMAFGHLFTKGEATEVTNPEIIAKLEGNSHFEVVKGRGRAKKPADPVGDGSDGGEGSEGDVSDENGDDSGSAA